MTRSSATYMRLFTVLISTSPCVSACFIAPVVSLRRCVASFVNQPRILSRHMVINKDRGNAVLTQAVQNSELEVEKKFPVPDDPTAFGNLKDTLTSLGFQMTHQEEFVDWYFDLPGPNWHFTLNDIWIRYREKKWKMDKNTYGWRGAWQVKRGKSRDGSAGKADDGMTVYQEYQGAAAKEMILDLLSNLDENRPSGEPDSSTEVLKDTEFIDFPHLDGAERLLPFSKFKTFRSCWQIPSSVSNKFSGLKVDIDRTDIGFAVGEVEAVFRSGDNKAAAVELGKEKIQQLVELLATDENNNSSREGREESALSMGKLEYYLKNNNKLHYNACIKAGVI